MPKLLQSIFKSDCLQFSLSFKKLYFFICFIIHTSQHLLLYLSVFQSFKFYAFLIFTFSFYSLFIIISNQYILIIQFMNCFCNKRIPNSDPELKAHLKTCAIYLRKSFFYNNLDRLPKDFT